MWLFVRTLNVSILCQHYLALLWSVGRTDRTGLLLVLRADLRATSKTKVRIKNNGLLCSIIKYSFYTTVNQFFCQCLVKHLQCLRICWVHFISFTPSAASCTGPASPLGGMPPQFGTLCFRVRDYAVILPYAIYIKKVRLLIWVMLSLISCPWYYIVFV